MNLCGKYASKLDGFRDRPGHFKPLFFAPPALFLVSCDLRFHNPSWSSGRCSADFGSKSHRHAWAYAKQLCYGMYAPDDGIALQQGLSRLLAVILQVCCLLRPERGEPLWKICLNYCSSRVKSCTL